MHKLAEFSQQEAIIKVDKTYMCVGSTTGTYRSMGARRGEQGGAVAPPWKI